MFHLELHGFGTGPAVFLTTAHACLAKDPAIFNLHMPAVLRGEAPGARGPGQVLDLERSEPDAPNDALGPCLPAGP